jgi:hypothetical protein
LKATPDKWAIITDEADEPRIVMDTTRYLYDIAEGAEDMDAYRFCHRPVVIKDPEATLGDVLGEFVVEADDRNDRIVDRDVILYWSADERRIITGADIFGRLLQGIARRESGSLNDDRSSRTPS